MSRELPQEFKCLVLFAALSGLDFSKSDLGVKMTVAEIERLNKDHGLLEITKKGRSLSLKCNVGTLEWATHNLNTELEGKNQAVRAVLDLVRAKAAAYLKAKQVSFLDFIQPEYTRRDDKVELAAPPSSDAAEAVREAYLRLSGGSYKARILLKDLRKQLAMDRRIQDAAFNELIKTGEADLYPEDDPMSRDAEDDHAALQIADRYRHVIYLNPAPRA